MSTIVLVSVIIIAVSAFIYGFTQIMNIESHKR
jgi:hypothetical protein